MAVAMVLMAAWAGWLGLARLPVYELSSEARLEALDEAREADVTSADSQHRADLNAIEAAEARHRQAVSALSVAEAAAWRTAELPFAVGMASVVDQRPEAVRA